MSSQSTAILLFSRTAAAEAEHKSFGGAGSVSRRITEALIARTESTLQKTEFPIFRSDESEQTGSTFGERLANAMGRVYAAGYEQLLVVGNDCPSASARHLRTAAQRVRAGQNVIGPDRRGGVWLIGLQRADFDRIAFAALPWKSPCLYQEMVVVVPSLTVAASLADLNTFEDLEHNWCFLRRQISELFDLLLLTETAFGHPEEQPEPVAVIRRLGRAPPY